MINPNPIRHTTKNSEAKRTWASSSSHATLLRSTAKAIVALENWRATSQTLLATKEGITKTRGRWFRYRTGTREIRAMPTFHPAFLLRNPISKRLAWRDFLAIKKALATAAT